MSDRLGPVAFEKIQQQFLEGFTNPRRAVSPKVTEEIDLEVKELIDGAHHIALKVLDRNRELLQETAKILLEKEVLEGQELKSYLNSTETPAEMDEWLRQGTLPQNTLLMQTRLNGQKKTELS
jgi:cell division protease FtsH